MKKIIVLAFFIVASSLIAYSQNNNELIKALKECNETKKTLNKEKSALNDSLKYLKNHLRDLEHNIEIADRRAQKISDSIYNGNNALNNEKGKPNQYKRNIKIQNDSIVLMRNKNGEQINKNRQLADNLQKSKQTLSYEKSEFKKEQAVAEKKKQEAEERAKRQGMSDIKNQVGNKYSKKTFDNKVYTAKDYVVKDQSIVKDSAKIDMLIKYYDAQSCLEKQYDAKLLAQSQKDIDAVLLKFPESSKATAIKVALTNYPVIDARFKKLIADMDAYNDKTPGLTDKVRDSKKMKFMGMISNFIGSEENGVRFSFEMYPYIADKLREIIVLKNKNDDDNVGEGVNKNVSYILNQ